jgi:hypothetical protein
VRTHLNFVNVGTPLGTEYSDVGLFIDELCWLEFQSVEIRRVRLYIKMLFTAQMLGFEIHFVTDAFILHIFELEDFLHLFVDSGLEFDVLFVNHLISGLNSDRVPEVSFIFVREFEIPDENTRGAGIHHQTHIGSVVHVE